jgi:hypothetical protein
MQSYEQVQRSYDIPEGAGPDTIADMVRGIMCGQASVQEVRLRMTPNELRQGVMEVDMYVPKVGPPDGVLPELRPGSVLELLQMIPLEEIRVKKPRVNLKALSKVVTMLLAAANNAETQARVPALWLIGPEPRYFFKWLGLKPGPTPEHFLGLPIFSVPFVEEDRLVLMCTHSRKSDFLDSKQGYVLLME